MRFLSENELKDFFSGHPHVAFYGTGGMGNNLYQYLRRNGWEDRLDFFVVTQKRQNAYQGVPVKDVHELGKQEKHVPIVIATRQNFHDDIRKELSQQGIKAFHTLSENLLNRMEALALQMYREQCESSDEIVDGDADETDGLEENPQNITDMDDYLAFLFRHKKRYMACIVVKDTPGLAFDEAAAEGFMRLGGVDLRAKHWCSYLFVMDQGKILINRLGNAGQSLEERLVIGQLRVQLASKPFYAGNEARIVIDGHDFSTNGRGLNFVLWDCEEDQFADSVAFDTNKQGFPCSRLAVNVLPEDWGSLDEYGDDEIRLPSPMECRYLYVSRFLRTGDSVLDLDAGHRSGAELLAAMASVKYVANNNSFRQIPVPGHASAHEPHAPFQGILALRGDDAHPLDRETLLCLHELLDADGFLAIAVRVENKKERARFPGLLAQCGFMMEEILYQGEFFETLSSDGQGCPIQMMVARKNAGDASGAAEAGK